MTLHTIAHIKRFLELLEGDPDFVREARENPPARQRLLESAGLDLAAADLAPFWLLPDMKGVCRYDFEQQMREFDAYPLWLLWRNWSGKVTELHEQEIATWVPHGDKRFTAWRTRQLARVQSEVFTEGGLTISPLFAFELSMGCSAQCWFCALDPPPLQGWFAYTESHRKLWRDLLETAWELFGPGCRSAVCYHATEPTDNPDYLCFLRDFHKIFGNLPQTTTSRPLKNIDWTRELLSLQQGCELFIDRFSVLNRQALHKIHQAFTPEELLNIHMVIQNEKRAGKALSGRTADPADVHHDGAPTGSSPEAPSCVSLQQMTIECTCGFLVNMVDRSIRLISPCNSSPRWPLGYEVHAEGSFRDASEFKSFILQSMEQCMPAHLGPNDRLAFRPGLQYERHDDGFSLISRYRRHDMQGNRHFALLGDLLLRGESTTATLTDTMIKAGMPIFTALSWLDRLYQGGLLAEPRG